jgi:GNAT superfamily N-acetyltransferase
MSTASTRLFAAESTDDYAHFARLIELYETWLRDRYESVPDLIANVREHQNLAAELEALPEKYGPPSGIVLLAEHDGHIAGGGAYRNLGDGVCEMKRVYVLEHFQGHGIGRLICEGLITRALSGGYHAMYLDTGFMNTEALALYERLGFRERDAYLEYPPAIAPHMRFMERALP